jgi:hypothetical protein
MKFYWLQDQVKQGQFRIFWAPGKIYLADYQSKVQPASVHRALQPIYLYVEGKSPTTLQGCDKILESLAAGTSAVTSQYMNTTAQFGSCNQASHTQSQLTQLVYDIALIISFNQGLLHRVGGGGQLRALY